MKLLLDQNISRKLLPRLSKLHPDSSHVFVLRMHETDDSDLWHYARLHGYTLVTKDADMVDLCIVRGHPPKVLWLRLGNCTTAHVEEVMTRNETRIREFESDPTRTVLSLFEVTPA